MLPFDLHVLSIPPAFNLSHDQTLQFNLSILCLSASNSTLWISVLWVKLCNRHCKKFISLQIQPCKCPHRLLYLTVKERSRHHALVSRPGRKLYTPTIPCQPLISFFFNFVFTTLKSNKIVFASSCLLPYSGDANYRDLTSDRKLLFHNFEMFF